MGEAVTRITWMPGQQVEWLYECRGGYGYRYWVPAVVVRVTVKRVTVIAQLRDGGSRQVSVKPDRLRIKPI